MPRASLSALLRRVTSLNPACERLGPEEIGRCGTLRWILSQAMLHLKHRGRAETQCEAQIRHQKDQIGQRQLSVPGSPASCPSWIRWEKGAEAHQLTDIIPQGALWQSFGLIDRDSHGKLAYG